MPTFQPPLSHTAHVSSQVDKYLQLNFIVAFDSGEDTSGQWELWTDLPSISSDDQLAVPANQWHAISFKGPHESSENPSDDVTPEPASTITLYPSSSHTATQMSDPRTLIAVVILPKGGQGVYAYTFRRILAESSDLHWLGGEGTNGIVECSLDVKGGQKDDQTTTKREGWEKRSIGFGLEVIDMDSHPQHHAYTLPCERATTPIISMLATRIPPHHTLFSVKLSSPSEKPVASKMVYTTYAVDALAPLPVQQDSFTPTASTGLLIRQTESEWPNTALEGLLNVITGSETSKIHLVKTMASRNFEDPAIFFVTSNNVQRHESASLVAFAADCKHDRVVDVDLSSCAEDGSPLAIQVAPNPSVYLCITTQTPLIRLKFPKETVVSQNLPLAKFRCLDICDDVEPIWIGSLEATRVEHMTPVASRAPSTKSSPLLESSQQHDHGRKILLSPNLEREVTEDALSAEENEDQDINETEAPWSFFSTLGLFFRTIFEWIFGFTTSPTTVSSSTPDGTADSDDEPDISEAQTPVDERTPLLRSPQISRATFESDSSSPTTPEIGSPVSKRLDGLPSFSAFASCSLSDGVEQQDTESAQTSSSLLFGFNGRPPFTFLLPPKVDDPTKHLTFSSRGKGSPWTLAAAQYTVNEMACSTVLVNVDRPVDDNVEVESSEWEVRVETK